MTPLIDAVTAMLADGPLPVAEIVRRLDEQLLLDEWRDEGVEEDELAEAVIDELTDIDAFWATTSDVVARTDRLLAGMVLTHRLTADELATAAVRTCPDLEVLDWNTDPEGLELAGGGRLRYQLAADILPDGRDSTWCGPQGWLDGFAPGDVLAFIRNGAVVTVERVDELALDDAEVAALRAAAHARLDDGEGDEAPPFLLDTMIEQPASFRRPVRPLGELLESAGLERRGVAFGWPGTEWRTFGERFVDSAWDELVANFGLNDCCIDALGLVRAAYQDFPDAALDADAVAVALRHGAVAPAFARLVLDDPTDDERLGAFASAVLAGTRGLRRVGPRYVLGIAAERRGDAVAAESFVRAALRDDPDYGPTALALVDFALDRGDLAEAAALLRHPDLSPESSTLELVDDLRRQLEAPWRHVGRNEPCPCGSGRKFKVCHARNPERPLVVRTRLLAFKLWRFAAAPHRRSRIVGVASSASDPDAMDFAEQIVALINDPVIADFAIYEGGLAERYLEERGHLLPADEVGLLAQVLDTTRALWEVVAFEPGGNLTLRAAATGEMLERVERTGPPTIEVGDLLLARVVRLEDHILLWGMPVSVPAPLGPSALDLLEKGPDADQLADWYGRAVAFPHPLTSDGEPFMLCHAELSTELGADDLADVFEGLFEVAGDAAWTDGLDLPTGERIVRGTVRLDGDLLHVDALSGDRMDELLAMILELVPDAEIELDDRRDVDDLVAEGWDDDDWDAEVDDDELDDLELDDVPGEVIVAIEGFRRQHEDAWLDESIPALGGLTPRQAAGDPSRRDDLLAVLRELEDTDDRGFDPERLRHLLGLS